MERKKPLDLADKSAWTLENASVILNALGYVSTLESQEALMEFIVNQDIAHAKVTRFLGPLASRYLGLIKPPIEKIKGSSLNLSSSPKK